MATRKTCACSKRQTTKSRRARVSSDEMFERTTGLNPRGRQKTTTPRRPTRAPPRAEDPMDTTDGQIKMIPKLALMGATTGMIMGLGAGMAGMFSNMGGN